MKKTLTSLISSCALPMAYSITILLCCCSLAACFPQAKQHKRITLYDFKTQYVGNNTNVVGIVDGLEFPEGLRYHSIAIDVIGMNTYCLLVKMEADKPVAEEELFTNAVATFALIGNLSQLKYVNSSNDTTIAFFRRGAVNQTLRKNGYKTCEKIGESEEAFFTYLDADKTDFIH